MCRKAKGIVFYFSYLFLQAVTFINAERLTRKHFKVD